jgi:hypothetical protein
MSLINRSLRSTVVGKRFFSSVSPKVAIAQHIMMMREISAAKDEATLNKIAAAGLPSLDVANPPSEFEDFKGYFALSAMKSTDTFTPDPTAWMNMPWGQYAYTEFGREHTWPFFIGYM